jgi:arabinose-5-phosphate isomerase
MSKTAVACILAIGSAVIALAEEPTLSRIMEAVATIEQSPQRVIVTGMGKCSHVGAKIAATLQSTGQPAAFLHPGEALHGDMGMIAPGDVILALSNSGETDEVLAVVRYAIENDCPVVVITSRQASPLAQLASAVVPIPGGPEGDPINRAPMASTAAMMAVGDAMAAELMYRRKFTEQDFLKLHHGGYLGRAIRKVA